MKVPSDGKTISVSYGYDKTTESDCVTSTLLTSVTEKTRTVPRYRREKIRDRFTQVFLIYGAGSCVLTCRRLASHFGRSKTGGSETRKVRWGTGWTFVLVSLTSVRDEVSFLYPMFSPLSYTGPFWSTSNNGSSLDLIPLSLSLHLVTKTYHFIVNKCE